MIERVRIKVRRVRHQNLPLPLPSIQTAGAAGYDLYADVDEPIVFKPKERILVPTGIAVAIPKGFEAQVRPRSGWAFKYGVTLPNTPGTIDSDYRGELKVILIHHGSEELLIQRGDRIAQLIIQRVFQIEWDEVSDLDRTDRDAGGFGHTGIGGRDREQL